MKTVILRQLLLLTLCLTPFHTASCLAAEEGMASYYADRFQGRKTASGEPYDKNKLTAAHNKLSFGTRVKVTSLKNKKSVTVTINDRGPYSKKRIIDLSRAAAVKIDLIDAGNTKVKIEIIK